MLIDRFYHKQVIYIEDYFCAFSSVSS
jgi:hypothetical protein